MYWHIMTLMSLTTLTYGDMVYIQLDVETCQNYHLDNAVLYRMTTCVHHFFLNRQYENTDDAEGAVHFFSKAGAYANAIRLCRYVW